jgi:hypothetical protein
MALSKKESNGPEACPVSSPDKDNGPRFPFCLEIRLDQHTLEKLGMTELPEVGERFRVRAEACVTSVSSNEFKKGAKDRTVCLQIERLAVDENEPESMEEAVDRGAREA